MLSCKLCKKFRLNYQELQNTKTNIKQIFLVCKPTYFVSVSGSVCVLSQLGWFRLLCSSGLQQPDLGNTAGHSADSGTARTQLNSKNVLICTIDEIYTPTKNKKCIHIYVHCCSTEPGPQVPPQNGPLYGGWTTGEPLDVWRTRSFRGHSGKCLQVGACNFRLYYCH